MIALAVALPVFLAMGLSARRAPAPANPEIHWSAP
jgi:hypothetical protein